MYRFLAFFISISVGGIASYHVYSGLNAVVPRWIITIGISAAVCVVVTLALYLPLLRHIADAIQDKFSTINSRFTARKTGLNFEDVPQATHSSSRLSITGAQRALCSLCGGPGGPICETCNEKMSTKK